MEVIIQQDYETMSKTAAGTVSKSTVSREAIEASAQVLVLLAARTFADLDLLVVYLDGLQIGAHHVPVALGVDAAGRKHVLGLREGASENSTMATAVLEDLVARGVGPERRRLFVLDGAKAFAKRSRKSMGRWPSCGAAITSSGTCWGLLHLP